MKRITEKYREEVPIEEAYAALLDMLENNSKVIVTSSLFKQDGSHIFNDEIAMNTNNIEEKNGAITFLGNGTDTRLPLNKIDRAIITDNRGYVSSISFHTQMGLDITIEI